MFSIQDVYRSVQWPGVLAAEAEALAGEASGKIENALSAERNSKTARTLNNIYWDFLNLILRARTRDASFLITSFSEAEKLFINFGLLDMRLAGGGIGLDRLIREQKPRKKKSRLQVRFFSEEIFALYRHYSGTEESPADTERGRVERNLAEANNRLKRLRYERKKIHREASGDAERLEALAAKFDRILPYVLKLEEKAASGRPVPAREKVAIDEFNETRENLRREVLTRFNDAGVQKSLIRIDDEIIELSRKIPSLEERAMRLKAKGGEGSAAVGTAYGKLYGDVLEMQKISYRYSGRESRTYLPIYFQGRLKNTRSYVLEAMAGALRVDAVMTKNLESGQWPMPKIVILPGIGEGSYEPKTNTCWIPLCDMYNYMSSVYTAVACYRFLKTEGLPARYAGITRFHKPRNIPALMAEFIKDYNVWMLKEAQGFRKLPGRLFKWFTYEFTYGGEDEIELG